MHQQFNIQQLYVLPTLYLCVLYLSENSDLCHLQHKLIGFYNRDGKCLLRCTNWVFRQSGLRFVFKGLMQFHITYVFLQKLLKLKTSFTILSSQLAVQKFCIGHIC